MIRPDVVGRNLRYYDPGSVVTFTSAELALIDSAANSWDMYPYAKSATVNEDYDEINILFTTQVLVNAQKFAVGLFLTPNLNCGSLLFNVVGSIQSTAPASAVGINHGFFFGRTSASAVTSSKAGASNILDNYIILPSHRGYGLAWGYDCINEQVLGQYVSDGEVWVFGVMFENYSGGDKGLNVRGSLTFSKFLYNVDCYQPDRS